MDADKHPQFKSLDLGEVNDLVQKAVESEAATKVLIGKQLLDHGGADGNVVQASGRDHHEQAVGDGGCADDDRSGVLLAEHTLDLRPPGRLECAPVAIAVCSHELVEVRVKWCVQV